jgi:FkbM family methyltransferase
MGRDRASRDAAVVLAPFDRRAHLMAAYGIDLVVDVGASVGQYASDLRAAGYGGRIVSFEPLQGPYGVLAAGAARDGCWEAHRLALGDEAGDARMNVSEDSRLLPVYGATASFATVTQLMADGGFEPIAFESVLDDPETGEMLQADAIFRRSECAEPPPDRIDPGQ